MNKVDSKNTSAGREKDLIEWAKTASSEEIEKAMRAINPYGVVIPDREVKKNDETTFSFSYTNYRMEFATTFTTTAMISYLWRRLIEYELPKEVPALDIEEYEMDPSIADPPAFITDERLLKLYAENKLMMNDRIIIHKFLKKVFGYNPDTDVRSSYKANIKDPERRRPNTPAIIQALENKNSIRNEDEYNYNGTSADLDYEPKTPFERVVFNTVPQVGFFDTFDRFKKEHFEPLVQCTKDLYATCPDVDFAVCIYEKHKNKNAAKTFKSTHSKDLRASMINVDANRWALLGSYRQNRERVDYFNAHTEVLKQMLDKRAEDEPLASDIFKKEIKNKKAENIAEAGPDDLAFRKWVKANRPDVAHLGADHVEFDNLEEAEQRAAANENVSDEKKDDGIVTGIDALGKTIDYPKGVDDCPDDAVEVAVFDLRNGGSDMTVRKIYNPVEAPEETSSK